MKEKGNAIEKIAVIYKNAYKVTGQAKNSANEILLALDSANPPSIKAELGNIDENIPKNNRVSTFKKAENKLCAFAETLFRQEITNGLYTEDEEKSVKKLVIIKALKYAKMANVDVNKAMQLVWDNTIKIHHQRVKDHKMLTGSDHGVRHIVQSNIANTLKVLDRMNVSAKQKLMAMQVMIDHDLGYTLKAAKMSFSISKDHPLASAAFVDPEIGNNPTYGLFDLQELNQMLEAVLKHSYPFGVNQPLQDDWNSIEKIISIVDAMGVTEDTKMSALFREDPYRSIMGNFAVSGNVEETNNVKKLLEEIIDANESFSSDLKKSYKAAVEGCVAEGGFSKNGMERLAPQCAGKMEEVSVSLKPTEEGKRRKYTTKAKFVVKKETLHNFFQQTGLDPDNFSKKQVPNSKKKIYLKTFNAFSKLGEDIPCYDNHSGIPKTQEQKDKNQDIP